MPPPHPRHGSLSRRCAPLATSGMMEEAALDFEHELYKFAGQREIVSRYVGFLAHFETLPQHATHCALKLLSKLIRQCKLEGMLFQLSVLHCLLKILELGRAVQFLSNFQGSGA